MFSLTAFIASHLRFIPVVSCLVAYPWWPRLPLLLQGETGLMGDQGPMGLPVSDACLLA